MSKTYDVIKKRIKKNNLFKKIEKRVTISFYCYFNLVNTNYIKDIIYHEFMKLKIFGRIYISKEGINAQINILKNKIKFLKKFLVKISPKLKKTKLNLAIEDSIKSFLRLRIRLKSHILADGINDDMFNFLNVGKYITAEKVNNMIDNPSIIFLDMRNYYEYEIGHFDNAIEIRANTFREQLKIIINMLKYYKNNKIVMYCTGGIRCEKASSWMKYHGFKKVYHLKGGIIGYFHRAKKMGIPIRFKGKNFVFDNRLSEKVTNDIISYCHQCYTVNSTYINCKNKLCNLLFIQCLNCLKKFKGYCSIQCKLSF